MTKRALITGMTGQDGAYLAELLPDKGHAKDSVEMPWLMLQREQPEDFVIATGQQYSVRDFVNAAAADLGMEIRWEGEGVEEKGYWMNAPTSADKSDAGFRAGHAPTRSIIAVDPWYFRPTEVETLLGDATNAREQLGWTPKITFEEMVREMMQNDLELAQRHALIEREGYKAFKYYE